MNGYRVTDSDGNEVKPGDKVTSRRHGAKATFLRATEGGKVEVDEPAASLRFSYPASEYGLTVTEEA